jgi:F-type H+-transporting ATPase subunit b
MHQRRRHWLDLTLGTIALLLVCASRVWAEAAAEGGHGGGLISLDKSLIVQIVNVVLLLFLLRKFQYAPFVANMEERSRAIKVTLEEALAARPQAATQQEENAERLRAAHAEAEAIRARALKDAAEEQRKLVEAARVESQRLVESAKAQLEAETRKAREDLRREVSDLAVAVAEKLVRKSLRDDDHRRILADAVARVGTS